MVFTQKSKNLPQRKGSFQPGPCGL